MVVTTGEPDVGRPVSDAGLVAFAREARGRVDAAERDLLRVACWWAEAHPVAEVEDAEAYGPAVVFGERPVPLGGPGCPLVAEFSVAELAAGLGLSTAAGKRLVGQALELRHRLPRIWARVEAGQVQAWRARAVAEATIDLCPAAAAHVDRFLAPVAQAYRPWQLTRLVEEAVARHDPDRAARLRAQAAEGRHVTVDVDQVSFTGTSLVEGEVDLSDALDLESALSQGAAALADAGSAEPLDVRRATALGELARGQLALALARDDARAPEAGTRADEHPAAAPDPGRRGRRPRQVVLHVHLAASAITGTGTALEVARVEQAGALVRAEEVAAWCGQPASQVVVRPVVDLADHVPVTHAEVPDRVREQVSLRDGTCVFPFCTRPARRLAADRHGADCDHVESHAAGGATCACNLAALCRTHHRVKTHDHRGAGWAYTPLEPGSYLWRSPLGLAFLRDHTGTHDVTDHDWTRRHLPSGHVRAPDPGGTDPP
jgi:hypothetical protein